MELGPVVRGCQVRVICFYFIQCHFPWLPHLWFYGPRAPRGRALRGLPVGWVGVFIFLKLPTLVLRFGWVFLSAVFANRCAIVLFALPSCFFFFLSFDWLLGSFFSFLMRDITSFIALVVLLMRVSICCMCFSVSITINSSIALACSSIMFALKFFAVSLFCVFSFAYSADVNQISVPY